MTRTRSSVLVLLAVAALAGCGGGKSKSTAQHAGTAATTSTSTTAAPSPGTSTRGSSTSTSPSGARPPSGPSTTGNGGTEPTHTDVELVGRGGRITPASVNVAPFVSIGVTLRSADGGSYRLRGNGLALSVSGGRQSASGTLRGLRTGATYTLAGSSKVVITATGEPGP